MSKKTKKSDNDAEEQIWEYMRKQNRPYNIQTLVTNLHESVSKKQAETVLDALVKKGKITEKEFGKTKIYWSNQQELPDVDKEGLAKLEDQIEELKELKQTLAEEVKNKTAEYKKVAAAPKTAELDEQIQLLEKENQELSTRLAALQKGTKMVSPESRAKVKKAHEAALTAYKKRKRMCMEMINQIQEVNDKSLKALMEDVGLETDEDAGFVLDDKSKQTNTNKRVKV
eukprot:TRINITY_DN2398_c0_g1_i1.p1 TRINITY_DN2398_c0_g1~~TRINITY_DN2398_c0_g1_i1.p1  ORF type:complete len:228 (-),score=66.07 TRINITY_DN2398_c0_g1_i1:135-818(-)